MGLRLTLKKEDNLLYNEFTDAYWKINDLRYSTDNTVFELCCFPSREASKKNLSSVPSSSLPVGGAVGPVYNTKLYTWLAAFNTRDIFPQGIPLDSNEQKSTIYEFIKSYTELPFEDVFEEI